MHSGGLFIAFWWGSGGALLVCWQYFDCILIIFWWSVGKILMAFCSGGVLNFYCCFKVALVVIRLRSQLSFLFQRHSGGTLMSFCAFTIILTVFWWRSELLPLS